MRPRITRIVLLSSICLCISLRILGVGSPRLSYAGEEQTATARTVDELLRKIETREDRDASAKLYSMGVEIEPALLQKLQNIDVLGMNDQYNSVSATIVSILSSRGYDKEVLEILKSRLISKNPSDRISAAIIIVFNYQYPAVRDLAGVISGEKDPEYLSERVMYEWNEASAEVVRQILEVMQGKSDEAKRFVIFLLKAYGLDCPECGYDTEKWKSFFDAKSDYVEFLGSDWWDSTGRSGHGVEGVRDLVSGPDGTKIAFVWGHVSEGRYKTDLCILDTLTNRVTRVQFPNNCYRPSWAPAGDRILFQYSDSKGFNIGTVRADGSEFCVWTKSFHSQNRHSGDGWSRDSSKFAYVRDWDSPNAWEIWITDLSKNKNMKVVKDNLCKSMTPRLFPTWFLSQDNKIFFWDCKQHNESTEGLYSVPLDSPENTELVQALDLDAGFNSMTPSPDGTKLAYVRDNCRLFIYNLDTRETKEYEVGADSYLTWTPDGKKILYSVLIGNGQRETRALSLETGESTKLSVDALWGSAFGPGGDSLYYSTRDKQTNSSSIRRVNLDGTNDVHIFPAEKIEEKTIQATPILKWAEKD
ncbi:hypothetical protein HZA56_22910 [Candidatus Poribacteria bacterium]|nr:hypothetical protein [Candidatus Poribacteria bacterium]